jgi:hypothetical protein
VLQRPGEIADQAKWTVHKDPKFPNDKMLMGYPGNSKLDSGFSFSFQLSPPDEPSAVDRLAAEVDPEIAERVEKIDKEREEWADRWKKNEIKVEKLG